jgi:soluble P-type ATPase
MRPQPVVVELPGKGPVELRHLVLDYTGTLSLDGRLLPCVARRLRSLARSIRVIVMTADTFGRAGAELKGLPVELRIVANATEKAALVRKLGVRHLAAIGNGRNDVKMVRLAALGIAVVGREGAAGELLRVADVVVQDIHDALDLLTHPVRLKATLRD